MTAHETLERARWLDANFVEGSLTHELGRAVVTYAAELSALRAEVERLRDAAETLLEVVHGSWFADDGTDSDAEHRAVHGMRAALTPPTGGALRKAGFWVAPMEPTRAMMDVVPSSDAGIRQAWTAMRDAYLKEREG